MVSRNADTQGSDMVEVTWSDRKLLIDRAKLDEWHSIKSEGKAHFIEEHPELICEQDNSNADDFVLVHWSGNKILRLSRKQLDEWFHQSFEMHVDFVKTHPEAVMTAEA